MTSDHSSPADLDPITATTCWACSGSSVAPIFKMKEIALSSLILVDTADQALAFPRGDLELAVCRSCGFIFNQLFRPEVVDYTMPYESSQDFSPRFRKFKEELVDHLVNDYELAGKDILEIGCGDASFLETLCRQAGARGFGVDPTFDQDRISGDVDITGLRDFYDAQHTHLTGDLICCRHTLEHIQAVEDFVALVRQSAQRRPGSVVFFEIPDGERILEEGAFWDVYYEHCSYFTLPSLANLFSSQGFQILRLDKGFDGQYLLIDGVVGDRDTTVDTAEVARVVAKAGAFGDAANRAVAAWRDLVIASAAEGRTVVLWGASSKAVAFLAAIDANDSIAAAVDINPFKQDKFLPGSGHPVIGPEALSDLKPDLVIVMNPIYLTEISESLRGLGLDPEMRALGA